MAANRTGYPTPPPQGEDHTTCPVCGWSPCTRGCRLGLTAMHLEELESYYYVPPREDPEGFLPPEDYEGEPE